MIMWFVCIEKFAYTMLSLISLHCGEENEFAKQRSITRSTKKKVVDETVNEDD